MNLNESFSKVLIIFIPISSFLVFPSIQGTTPAALIFLVLIFISIFIDFKIIKKFIYFIIIFFLYYLISQFFLYIYDGFNFNYTDYEISIDGQLFHDSILISDSKDYNFRSSAATQSLYLLLGYFCFIFFRKNFNNKYYNSVFISSYVLFLYGIFLFIYFIIFGECFDPLSNRIFRELIQPNGCSYGYQTINLYGIELHRIKSFTSEPSMYVLTALPYVVFAFFNKKYILCLIGFISLVLTFSTTFYIVFFLIILLILIRRHKINLAIFIFALLVLSGFAISYIYPEVFEILIFSKLNLTSLSGVQRFSSLLSSLQLFESLPIPSQIFGVGFGTIRTSDIFSTFLVNIGIFGTLIYLFLFFRPIFARSSSFQFEVLRFCVASVLLVLLIAVPEFSYLSTWFFLGVAYSFLDKHNIHFGG